MIKHNIRIFLIIGLLVNIFGCGQSGPLYLPPPDQQKAATKS